MAIQRQEGWANDSAPTMTGVDLTGMERRCVIRTSTGIRLAQAGEKASGVLQEGKAAGYWSSFATGGHPIKCLASAGWSVGQAMMVGADGTVVPGTTNSIGAARNAGLSGEYCEVMWDQVGSS